MSTVRIAINGYGRIGRCVLRALYESRRRDELQIVAINDLADNALLAHLTEFDSNHGRFRGEVELRGDSLWIDGRDEITLLSESCASQLPWGKLGVDVVLECTGQLGKAIDRQAHFDAGAKRVLVSAPCELADKTAVYGINHQSLTAADKLVSNASCTTNCLAPLAKVLDDEFGIVQGMMTTIHAYTNDQHLVDQAPGDYYRSRSAALSMIPTTTGAAAAVGLVLPQLAGKLDGMAVRVPTANVSAVDLHCVLAKPATEQAVNQVMARAAEEELSGILIYNERPLVSVDMNHCSASSIFDANHTRLIGNQLKVLSWYDNEWGFSNRMLDMAQLLGSLD